MKFHHIKEYRIRSALLKCQLKCHQPLYTLVFLLQYESQGLVACSVLSREEMEQISYVSSVLNFTFLLIYNLFLWIRSDSLFTKGHELLTNKEENRSEIKQRRIKRSLGKNVQGKDMIDMQKERPTAWLQGHACTYTSTYKHTYVHTGTWCSVVEPGHNSTAGREFDGPGNRQSLRGRGAGRREELQLRVGFSEGR